ncbi:hypothetical protein NIES970_22960 [[Synechococcus] sp. NIES-970]|nr:hypothetical protein NIES970_22960 [[Synechococcus] sp. NIES-970]
MEVFAVLPNPQLLAKKDSTLTPSESDSLKPLLSAFPPSPEDFHEKDPSVLTARLKNCF